MVTLLWWIDIESLFKALDYRLILATILLMLFIYFLNKPENKLLSNSYRSGTLSFCLYSISAFILCFSYFIVGPKSALLGTMWHHWGAYIGSSELIISGLRFYYDVPLQYGLGPSLVIAFFCNSNCWNNAFYIFSLTSFLYAFFLGLIIYNYRTESIIKNAILFMSILCASIWWISYPPIVGLPFITPSTSGMRFLIPVILSCFIIWRNNRDIIFYVIGFLIWSIGFIWSPEIGFSVSMIWFPIFILNQLSVDRSFSKLIKTVLLILTIVLLTVIAATGIYFQIFGVTPILSQYLAYILSPPGPMPINFSGSFLVFIFVFFLSIFKTYSLFYQTADIKISERSFTLQLLALSVLPYYFGRSHDNNILNLMPFIILLLVDCYSAKQFVFKFLSSLGIALILSFNVFFNWEVYRATLKDFIASNLNYVEIKDRMSYEAFSDTGPVRDIAFLSKLINDRDEKFTVLDSRLVLDTKYPFNVWSAIHGPVNFTFISSSNRRKYLNSVAIKLYKKDGWVIFLKEKGSFSQWSEDYDAVYDRVDSMCLEYACAIKYAPRIVN
jgi:hypothetical protein